MNSQTKRLTQITAFTIYIIDTYMIERKACCKQPIVGCIKDAAKTHIYKQ